MREHGRGDLDENVSRLHSADGDCIRHKCQSEYLPLVQSEHEASSVRLAGHLALFLNYV